MTRLLSLWLILLALTPIAQSTEDIWPLEGQTMASGTFRQTVTDINGAVAFSSTGRFAALKPDHFRWEIESPDRQLLVATPDAFWQWDKDLDVVILRDAPDITDLPVSAIWSGSNGNGFSVQKISFSSHCSATGRTKYEKIFFRRENCINYPIFRH